MTLRLPLLDLSREAAIRCYEKISAKRRKWLDAQLKDKKIKRGPLLIKYDSSLSNTFQTKFRVRWEGLFLVKEKYRNGTYLLEDLDDTIRSSRVNVYQLKKYVSRMM